MSTSQIRHVLSTHIGKVLTPELACEIELAATVHEGQSIDLQAFGEVEHDGYVIRAERLADILPELHPLHELHWSETEGYRHGLALNPDYLAFIAAEKSGRMLLFTVRKDGELVGNMRFFISSSLHTQTTYASEDTLYLVPSARGGFLSSALIKFAERSIKRLGIHEVRLSTKTVNKSDVLMRRLGYEHAVNGFVKFIKE